MSVPSPAAGSAPAPVTTSTPVPDATTTPTATTTTTTTIADVRTTAETPVEAPVASPPSTTTAENYPLPLPQVEQHSPPPQSAEPEQAFAQFEDPLGVGVQGDAQIHDLTGETTGTAAGETTAITDIHEDILALSEQDMEIANRSFSAVGGGFTDTVPSPFDAGSDPIALGQQHSDHHQVMGEGEPHNVHDPISITEPVSATVQASQSPFSKLNVHTPLPGQEQTTSADTTQPLTVQDQGQTPVQTYVDMTLPSSNDISSTDFFSTTSLPADFPTRLPTSSEQVSSAPPLSLVSAQPTTTNPTTINSIQTDLPQAPALEPPQLPQASTAPAPQLNTPNSLHSQAPTPIPPANPPPPPQYEPQFQPAPQPPPAHIPHPVEQLQHYQPPSTNYPPPTATTAATVTTINTPVAPPPLPTQTQPYQSSSNNYQYQPSSQPLNPNAAATVPPLQSSVSLPPIQDANGQHQQQQSQTTVHQRPQPSGATPSQVPLPLMGTIQLNVAPAPVQNTAQGMGHFYTGVPGTVTTADSFQIGREPNRLLSGGRAKKEVKRRTKTGCLTCRKRRIKCDERHPVCRNCEKSKRECLGYDPVFRSQTTTGTATLHPAPPSQSPSISGLSPVQSPQYATQHILIQHTTPTIQPIQPQHQQQQLQPVQPVQQQQQQQQQQARPLQVPVTTTAAPQPAPPPPVQTFDYTHPDNIKALANAAAADPPKRPPSNMLGVQDLRMRHVRIEDLLSVRGHVSPLPPESDVPLPRVEEIKMIYMSYANGIDKFLECHWYETKGLAYLLEHKPLLSQYSALLDGFNDRNIHDPTVLAQVESREASVIWNTFTLCRSAHARMLSEDGRVTPSNNDPELLYAVKRLSVIETMLTGGYLEANPVDLNSYPESDPTYRLPGLGGQIKIRELEFWQSIGRFLVFPGDDDPNDDTAQREKEAALLISRGLLDTFENRDVIYSIAIARHIAKYQPGKIKTVPATSDERDASSKLYVACRFLEDESRGKGTNQVIKRVAGMVVKYWEDPALMM